MRQGFYWLGSSVAAVCAASCTQLLDFDNKPASLESVCNETDGAWVTLVDIQFTCRPIIELSLDYRPTRAELSRACMGWFQPYLDDGTLSIDESALTACRAWIAAIDCETLVASPSPCDDLLAGRQTGGQPCEQSFQCAGDAYCSTVANGCGECNVRKPDGAICESGDECTNRQCDTNSVCGGLSPIAGDCVSSLDCAGRLTCAANACQVAMWSVGTACIRIDDCGWPVSGLFCDQGPQLCAQQASLGEACASATQCDLIMGQVCALTCMEAAVAASGEPCDIYAGPVCSPDEICSPSGMGGSICRSPDTAGSSCTDTCNNLFLTCVAGSCQSSTYTGECPAPM